jgi:hypothetical protein
LTPTATGHGRASAVWPRCELPRSPQRKTRNQVEPGEEPADGLNRPVFRRSQRMAGPLHRGVIGLITEIRTSKGSPSDRFAIPISRFPFRDSRDVEDPRRL